jgi:aspartate dehydrogenase
MHLGLIGYGGIAKGLLELVSRRGVRDVTVLVRPSTDVAALAEMANKGTDIPVRFVKALDAFAAAKPSLVVECAGHGAVASHVPELLRQGLDVIIASIGALADEDLHQKIIKAAQSGTSRFILPSGAIGGLDILRTAAQSGKVDVTYRGIKPALAWTGTPAGDALDLAALTTATPIFSGSGREAAIAYPKNANVVAALALAGAGFDDMTVELIADPDATSNQHSYAVVSPVCRFSMSIASVPSAGNAKTSMTTILSILHEIKDFETRLAYSAH